MRCRLVDHHALLIRTSFSDETVATETTANTAADPTVKSLARTRYDLNSKPQI
jgi:hypothetical protein